MCSTSPRLGEQDVDGDEVREILRSYSEAEFLDEDWFWMPSGKSERNRLYNVTRRMLSVVQPMDVSTIRDGLRRHYPYRGVIVPPKRFWPRFMKFIVTSRSTLNGWSVPWIQSTTGVNSGQRKECWSMCCDDHLLAYSTD